MKKIIEEITCQKYHWQAIDGTNFDDEEECKIYEKSAVCIIKSRVNKLAVGGETDAWNLMGGCDDHTVQAYKITSEAEAAAFAQWIISFSNWWSAERQNEIINDIMTAGKNKDVALVGYNCDGDPYYINTRQNIIDNLMNLDESK